MTFTRPFVVSLFLVLALASSLRADTSAQVDAAVEKAVGFLYSKQHDGNWENVATPETPGGHDSTEGGQWGGLTGIATYALLSADQNPADDRMKKAVAFLQKAKMRGVYAISMRAQVWPLVPATPDIRDGAKRDATLLMNGAKNKGPARGMWFYYVDDTNDDRADHSASQFALLGIWACEEAGVEIPTQFWRVEDGIWREHQNGDGSWAYMYKDDGAWGKPFLSMTCAGLASLFITQDKLNDPLTLNCKAAAADATLPRGLDWVGGQFPNDFDRPGPQAYVGGAGRRVLYLLYGLHRLGLASGYRSFGGHDWFRAGADYLLKTQQPDGSWGNVWETSFGLLFLARGRAPIAFNKLDYGTLPGAKTQTWNARPRDIANVTTWIGKQAERRVSWQIVNVNDDPLDWLDAPVLYLGGSDDLNFSPEQQKKLQQYVEAGGLIVGNADCGNAKFSASFRKLGQSLFSAYEFRELPDAHPIYTQEQFLRAKWKIKPHVFGLNNGVRELMLLLPDLDPSRAFQAQASRSKAEAFELAFDFYQYAAGLDELRRRGDSTQIVTDPRITAAAKLRVARLKYAGNWNPEPGGWRRLASYLHNTDKLDLSVEPVDLGTEKLAGFTFAHLTGTAETKLTDAQRTELKQFVGTGGTLLVDSAGGNADFAASMDSQLAGLFGKPLTLIDATNKLYTAGDAPLTSVTYRRAARKTVGNEKAPLLKGIEIDGRLAVLFSAEDLSAGLVGQPTDGISGYTPASTLQLARRVLLFGREGKAAGATP